MTVKDSIKAFYRKNYKKLLVIPLILTLFSFTTIISTYLSTGELVRTDIELKGGIISTLDWDAPSAPDLDRLEKSISAATESEIVTRSIKEYGSDKIIAITFEAESHVTSEALKSAVGDAISEQGFSVDLATTGYSTKEVGPSMGQAFIDNAKLALAFGFILISLITYFNFRNRIASLLIITSGVLNVTGAVAVMNVLGIKLSPGTIAALLMILGYADDANVLVTTSILKKTGGDRIERAMGSLRTGMMMLGTTMVSLAALAIVSNSQMLSDMAIVLFAGIVFDISNTWLTNVGVLLWLEEKKDVKAVA